MRITTIFVVVDLPITLAPRMTSPSAPISPLSIRALTRRYGEHVAICDLSLEIQPGEIVGLLGPNGAGKTTLLETIEGIQSPTQGEVLVFGSPPRSIPAHVRAKIGFVFQRNALPGHATVAHIITLYRRIYGNTEELSTVIAKLGLEHLLTRRIDELSIGQCQRLSVFAALAGSPSLLLMDEPTSALDVRSRQAVWSVILEQKRERSLSGLIATHDMEEAQTLCDRVVFIEHGQLQGELIVSALQNQMPSTLTVRFSAPQGFVDANDFLKTLIAQTEQTGHFYRVQCPKHRLCEFIAVMLAGEHSHHFDARLEISQNSIESAYLNHVAAAD